MLQNIQIFGYINGIPTSLNDNVLKQYFQYEKVERHLTRDVLVMPSPFTASWCAQEVHTLPWSLWDSVPIGLTVDSACPEQMRYPACLLYCKPQSPR